MVKGLYTAWTAMINEQHRMDVATNNLANANTNGYKKEGSTQQTFDSQLALKIKDTSEPDSYPRRLGPIVPGSQQYSGSYSRAADCHVYKGRKLYINS